jgi:transcriptional regulator with XRE-family HTH domain
LTNRIKQWRGQMGISQTKLASVVGVAQGNLSRVETGKMYAWPKLRRTLCEALEATEEELFPLDEAKKP